MYTVTYQYGTPDGKIRSSYRWTQAKDEADAKLKIAEILGKDTTIKWFKIGKTTKIPPTIIGNNIGTVTK